MRKKRFYQNQLEKLMRQPAFASAFQKEKEKLALSELLAEAVANSPWGTQHAFAKAMGTSEAAVHRYLSGRYDRFELSTLKRFLETAGYQLFLEAVPAGLSVKQKRPLITVV